MTTWVVSGVVVGEDLLKGDPVGLPFLFGDESVTMSC
jgi:hypothetical protein